MNTKRMIAIALGPALLALGADAYISHFMGHDADSAWQWVPVVFAPIGMIMVIAWGALRLRWPVFRTGLVLVGVVAVFVGVIGTYFHLEAIWEDLSDEEKTWGAIQGALGSGPPVFAPLSFAGVGALLILLAQARVFVQLLPKGGRDEAVPPERVAELARSADRPA